MTITHEARELDLYISNTQPIWAIVEAIARHYERKRKVLLQGTLRAVRKMACNFRAKRAP